MIAIIDYGLGNVSAFENLYKRLNIPVVITKDEAGLKHSNKLILPGVGAFDGAMQRFDGSGLRSIVEDLVLEQGIPILGVCVGMQMLAESSEEGIAPGLSWIAGKVRKLDASLLPHKTHLPHMGWNDIFSKTTSQLLRGLEEDARFYFLHSYYFDCADDKNAIAEAHYGTRFTCVVNHKNIYGVQFHPEKSHHYGVQLLKNFADL